MSTTTEYRPIPPPRTCVSGTTTNPWTLAKYASYHIREDWLVRLPVRVMVRLRPELDPVEATVEVVSNGGDRGIEVWVLLADGSHRTVSAGLITAIEAR